MPRSSRQVPNVYFGRPGALVTLPWPLGDIDKPYERVTYDFVSGGGQHTVSTLSGGSRAYAVKWNALHLDTYSRLEQYWTGNMGMGPWAFIDPSVPNMLLPNQASATNNLYDATGFEVTLSSVAEDNGALFSSTQTGTMIHRPGGTRALRWHFPVAPASFPVLQLSTPYRNWPGYPAVPGLPYMFSCWARPDSVVDGAITLAAKLRFLDATGTLVGAELSGGDVNMNAGYVQHTVGGVAPAGTAFVRPLFVATGSTINVNGAIFLDELQLEQDSVVNSWAPGTGVRPVEMLSFPDTVPFDARMRRDLTLNLRELAA